MTELTRSLLIIDPQNDFSDHPEAALAVPGALADAERLAAVIERLGERIDTIHVTLDTHQWVDVAHPIFWVDAAGNHPEPFTTIKAADVEQGSWQTYRAEHRERGLAYVRALASNGRYDLVIWPPHCLVGGWGHNVMPPIHWALRRWEENFKRVDFIPKGMNPWTEHYSAIRADVPDSDDSNTQSNTRLLTALEKASTVAIGGQALSHCVASTVRDIIDNIAPEAVSNLVFLEDTSSPVPGFEDFAAAFLQEIRTRGVRISTAAEFLG